MARRKPDGRLHNCRGSRVDRFFYIVLAAVFLFHLHTNAQDSLRTGNILLLPYRPDFYLSDAERDISRQSGRDPDEFRTYFRTTLDEYLEKELDAGGNCKSLLKDTSAAGRNTIGDFYYYAALTYQEPMGPAPTGREEKKGSKRKDKSTTDIHTAPHSYSTRGDTRYMQAAVKDTTLLRRMAVQYKADHILSINQLEIKTNYNTCIDIANKIYRREVIVHYSIFDKQGREVAGNYAFSFFPSDSNKDTEIVERCFPEISAAIASQFKAVWDKSRK